ncbi:hypothetical protein GCM10010195_59720 [Kitasatospora griseola]|nr:hypothetical protein GCM10010195_59720 [Kitasatospora griseola]
MDGQDDAEQGWHVRSLREGKGAPADRPVPAHSTERVQARPGRGRAAAPRAQVVGVSGALRAAPTGRKATAGAAPYQRRHRQSGWRPDRPSTVDRRSVHHAGVGPPQRRDGRK